MNFQRAIKKALQSPCQCKVAAIALDKKGNLLGYVNNKHGLSNRKGNGKHAEREAFSIWGLNIGTLIICRVNMHGKLLPVHPCPTCRKVMDKHGIRIVTLTEDGELQRHPRHPRGMHGMCETT